MVAIVGIVLFVAVVAALIAGWRWMFDAVQGVETTRRADTDEDDRSAP